MKKRLLGILLLSFSLHGFCQHNPANQPKGTMIDERDNLAYKWVLIGEQKWMAENLKYETPKGSWIYEDDTTYLREYGRLYNNKSAKTACPEGWVLPGKRDWEQLIQTVSKSAGTRLRTQGNKFWLPSNTTGTNSYSFNAVAGGSRYFREVTNSYADLKKFAMYWTSTNSSRKESWVVVLYYRDDKARFAKNNNGFGYSVRCINKE
ncbi:MAG: FISUMP domain-containing protein [candidate division Zixibacteria bacterium]|nr:FISUMP domain-containing protein [candidate division Zixibacteria bacterium]